MTETKISDNVIPFRREPRILSRSEHNISRSNIADAALKVMYRLRNAGFKAYLVGGSVRDLLLGREPKDFDVATDALPEQVRELFRNCRLIGRRFRLAHVHFGQEIIEVATFRGSSQDDDGDADRVIEDGRIVRDNVYGTLEDDVWRRDFTVNALYYNIEDFTVVDYVGGVDDVRAGRLRLLGDPDLRYREDPVRMLRAVRFAVKLGFLIHPDSERPILELGHLLTQIPPARLFDEMLKLFLGGSGLQTFEMLRHYQLFGRLFPQVEASLAEERDGFPRLLLARALESTDYRVATGKPVTPAFLLAAMLWMPVQAAAEQFLANGVPRIEAFNLSADAALSQQVACLAIPRRYTQVMRDIWNLQGRLPARAGRRAERLLTHPKFRAGFDFLLLRRDAGENVTELADWWTRYLEADEAGRAALVRQVSTAERAAGAAAPGRRRRRRKPVAQASDDS